MHTNNKSICCKSFSQKGIYYYLHIHKICVFLLFWGENMRFNKLIVSFTAVLSLLAFPVISIAADADSANLIEEVTVTARKREENLLDIAETITAISATDIDRQNIKTLDDIGSINTEFKLVYESRWVS